MTANGGRWPDWPLAPDSGADPRWTGASIVVRQQRAHASRECAAEHERRQHDRGNHLATDREYRADGSRPDDGDQGRPQRDRQGVSQHSVSGPGDSRYDQTEEERRQAGFTENGPLNFPPAATRCNQAPKETSAPAAGTRALFSSKSHFLPYSCRQSTAGAEAGSKRRMPRHPPPAFASTASQVTRPWKLPSAGVRPWRPRCGSPACRSRACRARSWSA